MKKILVVLFMLGVSGGYSPVFSYSPGVDAAKTTVTQANSALNGERKKRSKGYKKPKKKKFLGIFKRKSACDCPRH